MTSLGEEGKTYPEVQHFWRSTNSTIKEAERTDTTYSQPIGEED